MIETCAEDNLGNLLPSDASADKEIRELHYPVSKSTDKEVTLLLCRILVFTYILLLTGIEFTPPLGVMTSMELGN